MTPSVESLLTRDLDLRFIDARTFATEARVVLGIDGYPSSDQVYEVRDEAIRIFATKSEKEKQALRRMNWELEAAKSPTGSVALSDYYDAGISSSDCGSIQSMTSSRSGRGNKGGLRGILFQR